MKNLILIVLLVCACVPMAPKKSNSKRKPVSSSSGGNLGYVDFGYGRVMGQNPVVASGNENLSYTADLSPYVDADQVYITTNSTLTKTCTFSDIYTSSSGGVSVADCFKVYLDTNSISQMTASDARWSFDVSSDEFMQVQTYYHFSKAIDKMFELYQFVHNHRTSYASTFFSSGTYQSAFVDQMATYNAFWDVGLNSGLTAIEAKSITAYAKCSEAIDNAFFRPTDLAFCMGYSIDYPGVYTAHDPSVIYHEFGHFFVHTALNHRNTALEKQTPVVSLTTDIKRRSSLGYRFYDEAGAINEGIADFFTAYINNRNRIFEWAFKFGYPAVRPLSESESLHKSGIGTDSESRVRYPTYTDYDVYAPNDTYEDIHVAGQIPSHFFTALSYELNSSCGYDITTSRKYVLQIITETLAELGTLSGQLSDDHSVTGGSYIYLNQVSSLDWQRLHTPITFRSFFQTFAKYAYGIISMNYCVAYTKDRLEKLLDDYGLLLFKNFNFDGNSNSNVLASTSSGHTLSSTGEVNHSNRVKSVLLAKDLIGLSDDENDPTFYVVDSPAGMRAAVEGLRSLDPTTTLSASLEGLPYNNGNGQISPGEVVGIALNLYNKSNSDMAGIQVLANAWDHTATVEDNNGNQYHRPCTINGWPLSTEGGVGSGAQYDGSSTLIDKGCDVTTADNGVTATDKIAPICFMEWRDTNETRWVSQEEFLELSNMSSNKCLYESDKDNCFIKPLNNAQEAWFSKIEAQKNYLSTFDDGATSPTFNVGNIVIFEVSKEIMPGTKFMCRFRTRFTNCSDCFIDDTTANNDDYLDYQYSGADPYKVINIDFMVIN